MEHCSANDGADASGKIPEMAERFHPFNLRPVALRRWRTLAVAAAMAMPAGVSTATTPRDYKNVGISVPVNATLPLDASVETEKGNSVPLRQLVRQPTVLVFADFTCSTLCGPVIAFVAGAIEQSGLRPGDQYRVLVIGLDPKDTLAEASQMKAKELPGSGLANASVFVRADAVTVEGLTSALGYRFIYDREHDQFVHPGAAYVLRADGRVSRVLTGLGLTGADMRLALVEAGEGRIGTFSDRVRLLCSGFDPAHGVYNVMVSRVLAGTGLATILALGGLLGLLSCAGRRRSGA